MPVKVMLIEDESGIRKLLRKIIERQEGFEVAAESDNFAESILLFHRYKPEVVFLDIEIKGESGIECAKIIADISPKTKIIFATAHSEYMPDAFEVYAFDYLVKPFQIERVERTLARVRDLYKKDSNAEKDYILKPEHAREKLLVKSKESISFVDVAEIIVIQKEGSSTVIYTEKDVYKTSASLSEVESKLEGEPFLRCHKSYIINLTKIKQIEPYGRWTYVVKFRDAEIDALMTAEKYEEVKNLYR